VIKPSADSRAQWRAWGIRRVFVAAIWTFQAGSMYDCGSVGLDRVSSVCQVVGFFGACAAMLRMSWSEKNNVLTF